MPSSTLDSASRSLTDLTKLAGLWLLRAAGLILILGSLLSMTDLNEWWVRIWDFPRVQILIAMVMVAIALWLLDRGWRPWFPFALTVLSIWQLYRVYPYTPFADTQVANVSSAEARGDGCFTALTLNVLQTNRDYQRTADFIRQTDADIVLLMETDQAWGDAMTPALASYEGQIHRLIDNKYGLMFASRLPMRDASIQDLAQKDTPSVFATLTAGSHDFRIIGLHPRPPQPDQDTEERDAELIVAAKKAKDLTIPALAIGDFNDVAWSDTTELFIDLSGFLDPRIGRGTFATFPADMTWLGWPLDHTFVTEEFLLEDIEVGASVGSDHRPIIARLCLDPGAAKRRNDNVAEPDAEDQADAREVMQDFDEDTASDRVEGEGN